MKKSIVHPVFLHAIVACLLLSTIVAWAIPAFAHEADPEEIASPTDAKAAELISIPAMPQSPPELTIAESPAGELQSQQSPPAEFQAMPAELLPPEDFYLARVKEIIKEGSTSYEGEVPSPWQELTLVITSGAEKNKTIHIDHGKVISIREDQKVKLGETIVIAKTSGIDATTGPAYYIYDRYRLPPLVLIAMLFFALVVIFGGRKGLGSILGLAVTFFILTVFIVPGIFNGGNPLLYSIVGSAIISVATLYLAHGFNRQTSIALVSTLITLTIASVLALIFVELTHLTGTGTEEAFYLTFFGPLQNLNLKGLLLGGIIIGALGVLDDVTTSQTAAVHEIHKANPRLPFKDLYKRGLAVGREHIASLVNTLVLAYAGTSLPLFLIFSNADSRFLWTDLNGEFMVEEIVRTLVGSSALILAVPIVTLLAAHMFTKKTGKKNY